MGSIAETLIAGSIETDTSEQAMKRASRDGSQIEIRPRCVVRPKNTGEIAEAVRICNAHSVPLSIAGGYTGLSGGALGYDSVRIEMKNMDSFSIEGDTVRAEGGASVPEIIRRTHDAGYVFPVQPASACRVDDVYDYLGATIGPVTVGGSIGANASGLVGCKLGAAREWIRELTVVLPDGEIITTDDADRFAGTEGRYGIVAEAVVGLAPLPGNIATYLVRGKGLWAYADAAVSIGRADVLPYLAESMVMSGSPPDLRSIAGRTFDDPDGFLGTYGDLFGPDSWLILLQGSADEVKACLDRFGSDGLDVDTRELSEEDFTRIKQIRSAASDDIGTGVENPDVGKMKEPPVKRAARFLTEAVAEFARRGIRPKAEHNFGNLWVFLAGEAEREQYRRDVADRIAFDDGRLALYEKCGGDLTAYLETFLAPSVTDDMVRDRIAVNFPGNEDILIRAESFLETMEVLDGLMEKYGACPVPLYYCHINFRRQKGWILVHNRLLLDVREFV